MQNFQQYRRQANGSAMPPDPRWAALDAARSARKSLGLKERSITVLRGLLSLIPAHDWEGSPTVHASNATLQERCDGIDERTLRRHLATLEGHGLIRRRQSPNRKRYTVRDGTGSVVLSYGFDLSPLRDALPQLQALAEQQAEIEAQIRVQRALLRDRLYHISQHSPELEPLLSPFRRLLRRNSTVQQLEEALSHLDEWRQPQAQAEALVTTSYLSDDDGQTDRHIQSSHKESIEIEGQRTSDQTKSYRNKPVCIDECIERASTAIEFAPIAPRTWDDLCQLARNLGPSLGIRDAILDEAHTVLGDYGYALAVLGLTQAYPQIRQPSTYLFTLLGKARNGALNIHRMFRSLTAPRRHQQFPAGNHA